MANLFADLIDEMNNFGYMEKDIDFITTFQLDNECNIYRAEVPIADFETEAEKVDSQRGGMHFTVVMTDKSHFNYEYSDSYGKYFWAYYSVIERPDVKIKNFSLTK